MNPDIESARRQLGQWLDRAHAIGWLADGERDRLVQLERGEAGDLFSAGAQRPLLVGFFGGTGVGKSSLLNRLAGEAVARVGVERPTSREVTLYLHESHQLADLPAELPLDATQVVRHHHPRRRDVAWIDMPDVDSVETANRQLVLAWLPYLDWIVYVVSPERYRDDVGWRLLHERAQRHRWLFVMNQSDLGSPDQRDQFSRDLAATGLAEPRVLMTSCVGGDQDEFDELERIIVDAIAEHGLQELQRLGVIARLRDLAGLAQRYRQCLGDRERLEAFIASHRGDVKSLLAGIESQLAWPIDLLVQRFPARRAWLRRVPPAVPAADEVKTVLWTDQASEILHDISADAEVQARESGLPAVPVVRLIDAQLKDGAQTVRDAAINGLYEALRRPGSQPQRAARATMRILGYLLPLSAAGWAAYHLVTRYNEALSGTVDFLGLDFAVHSLLLIFLGWLVPFLVQRVLEPSPRANARRGLERGVQAGLRQVESAMERAYDDLRTEHGELLISLEGLSFEPRR